MQHGSRGQLRPFCPETGSANTSLWHSTGVDDAKLVDLPCVATTPVIMFVERNKAVSDIN